MKKSSISHVWMTTEKNEVWYMQKQGKCFALYDENGHVKDFRTMKKLTHYIKKHS